MDAKSIVNAAAERQQAGDHAGAAAEYRRLLSIGPNIAALNNLAVALEQTGQFDEARTLYEAAAVVAPDDVGAQRRLANFARVTRQPALAERAYRRALELDPGHDDTWTEFAMVLLGTGRYAEGWRYYDHRSNRRALQAQRLAFPEWQGEPLAGKRLFVWREQGLGDQIMMARFLSQLGAAQITYAGQPPLGPLFSQLPGVTFVPVTGDYALDLHDYWIVPMSIPGRLGITLENLPNAPYLAARPRPDPAGRIGFAWKGEPKNTNDRYRSLPEAEAARILARPGVISLHPEDTGARDLQETAELIAALDLVIAVDTAVAHLAGAMGKPCFVLLAQHALDWQWLWGRADSPWYPSARLFWQERPGDWAAVVTRALAALPEVVAG